ncbi:hypothetical protein T02_2965 [Trichinella nativa]|uniref:Uncharacterized protein n=1 Tax=Trichinella nativa TaxID=6335 RepID=A0A0V1LAU4_9BILA|nr:hypothetical protein T02_2965 [Trichinella nativa]
MIYKLPYLVQTFLYIISTRSKRMQSSEIKNGTLSTCDHYLDTLDTLGYFTDIPFQREVAFHN